MNKKILLVIILVGLIILAKYTGATNYLTLEFVKANQESFQNYYAENSLLTIGIYSAIYIVSTALSLPGATILTLLGGGLFGLPIGLLVVSFASTMGATLSFLIARFLFRDTIEVKFSKTLAKINKGIEKEGNFYLFSLRLIPLFPFFVINMVMGLTKMRVIPFFFISQIGMLLGTAVYVNAGVQLAELESLAGIFSPGLLISFSLLGILPLVAKKIVGLIQKRKVYKNYKKPKHFDYNMIAIGAGAAGLVTSYISSAVKAKVALIEKHKMGGDCLNTGCVPSKSIIRSAKVAHSISKSEIFGLKTENTSVDFKKVMGRVHQVIEKIEPHDSIERYTDLGVECIQGAAKILSPWEVEVNGKVLTTKNITIATGASPFIPSIPGIKEVGIRTSENLWELTELPQKFVVLGGGPIGVEIAQAFARLGSTVTLVVMSERIMHAEDEEVSELVQKRLTQEGVYLLLNTKASAFKKVGETKFLTIESSGTTREIEFDEVLVAVGRKANVTGFGLEELGIELNERGTLEVNEYLQTKYPNIYACGDVAGPYQLTHVAAHQAWYAAVNGLFGALKKFKVDYSVIPWATYTDPEVATVGLTEQAAKQEEIPYELITYGIDDLDRAIADSEDHGIVRVLVSPGTDKILGATIVGQRAGDIIIEFITAMKYKIGLNKILGTIHIYPTMAEANKYLAGNWKRRSTNPKVFPWLEKFHRFMREVRPPF